MTYTTAVLRKPLAEPEVHLRTSAFEFLLELLERRYHALAFQLDPSLSDVRVCSWRGWQVRPYFTYLVDLGGQPDPSFAFSSARKRMLRSEQERFTVAEEPGGAGAAVRLCAESYARHGRGLPGGVARVRMLAEQLVEAGLARVFTATSADATNPEAAVVLLADAGRAHYWIAGSSPGPSMTVLLGSVLPKLREEGCATFDFVGANTPSIAEFKRQFGGTLVPYYGIRKTPRPELRLLDYLRAARARVRRS